MRININDIVLKPGWKKWISMNLLIIEEDVEFDLFAYCFLPYFVMPISIDPVTQALEVNPEVFRAWHTQLTLSDVIEL